MNAKLLLILVALGLGAAAAPAQIWHDEQYAAGGYPNHGGMPPGQAAGIWILRSDFTSSLAALPSYSSYGFCMDIDNRHLVVACQGPPSGPSSGPGYGIFRFDPRTLQYTTIYGPNTVLCNPVFDVHINSDGEYLFNAGIGGSQTDYRVMKVDRSGRLTTVLTSAMLGRSAYLFGKMATNIDTGNLLVFDRKLNPDHIWEVAPNGTVTTFYAGQNGARSWTSGFSLTQNHRNGYIEGPHGANIYRVKPGTAPRTTLHSLGGRMPFGLVNAALDLQTGTGMRWVCTAGYWNATWIIWLDYATGAVTSTRQNFRGMPNHDISFFRGHHIQTVRVAPHAWSIYLSCPRSPGRRYALAAGMSGVRPGVSIGAGHHLNLNVDALVVATLQNTLPALWNPGPGTLNTQGEARGKVDVSGLAPPPGGFGIPIWIAMVVLDPAAPGGIGYAPDTYVMRL